MVRECHGRYPKEFVRLKPKEAEFVKYFNNVYNSTLITFANSFYELCKEMNVDYTAVKNACVKREHIYDRYLDANRNIRGFGGACLPKDTSAIAALSRELGLNVDFFDMLLSENAKYKCTVIKEDD